MATDTNAPGEPHPWPEPVSMFDTSIDDPGDAAGRRLALLLGGFMSTQVVSALAQLGVPDELGQAGRPPAELAAALGLPVVPLTRLLRAATTFGVVRVNPDGTFSATPLSDRLRTGVPGSLRDSAIGFVLPPLWSALGNLADLVRTGTPADPQLMWDYARDHPDAAARFAGAMARQAATLAGCLRAAGYAPPPGQRIVDVGGSRGILLSYLLQAVPGARGVLFDRAEALAAAPAVLAAAGVEDRAEVVTGNFMTEVPDGDLHVLCHVLHDWDDEIALAIARNCYRASHPGGGLLVIEYLLPTPAEPSLSYLMDILMMTVEAGGERTREEFTHLLGRAGYSFGREVPVTSPGRQLPQRILEFRRV
ncbi:MAG: methyltransferase [Actinobacteria bacterium]|nr:methyltransferase [Actinomycetota bacterium]